METPRHPELSKLTETLGDGLVDVTATRGEATAILQPGAWAKAARLLKEAPECRFDLLVDLTVVDYLPVLGVGPHPHAFRAQGCPLERRPRFEVVAHLYSIPLNHRVRIKTGIDEAELESLTPLWGNANWLEREAYDLFGIRFRGHPDLRRILLYEEFEGHALRKDYPLRKQQPLLPLIEVEEPVHMSSEPQRFAPHERFKT